LEEKSKIFYDFARKLENRRMLESQIMYYISFQEERILKKEIGGTLRNYVNIHTKQNPDGEIGG
jgi:hypothetical protein